MAGEPWKDYQTPSAPEGPWTEYQGPTIPRPTQAAPAQPEKSGLVRRVLGDSAIDVGKGVIDLGQAAVGLADLGTAGLAGKALEQVGYDPQGANEFLSDYYSPERKQANQAVNDAHGFLPTIKAMVQNPSTIAGSVLESAPSTIGGGVGIARGVAAKALPLAERLAPKLAEYIPTIAGGIGEGAIQAGQSAEQSRATSDDKLLSAKQAVAAVGSGAVDALISSLSGATAQKLGIADIDTLLAGGKVNPNTKPVGILKRALEGIVQEGLLEELPQSAQEQMFQNYATGQPLMAGVPEAAAQGALTGAVQGGATSAVVGGHHVGQDKQQTPTTEQPAAPTQAEPATSPAVSGDNLPNPPPYSGGEVPATGRPMASPEAPGPLTHIRNKVAESAPLFPDAQPGDLAHAANTLAGQVDTTTGEYVPPTDDAIKGAMHAAMEQQFASAGKVSRRLLRETLPDVEAKRFNPLLDQVLAERKNGITSASYQTEQSNGPGSLADAAESGLSRGGLADAAGAGADQLGSPVPADAGLAPAAEADTGNRNDTGGAERPLADEAAGARAEGGLTVPASKDVATQRAPLNVRMGKQEYPIGSIEEASARFLQLRDQVGDIGGMRAVEITDRHGRTVGYIGHNGEVYEGPLGNPNAKTLYDPQTPNRYAADVIDAQAQAPRQALTYDTSDQLQDSDIVPPSGSPYSIRDAAEREAARHEGGRVFPVDGGGFVVRVPQAGPAGTTSTTAQGPADQAASAPAAQAPASPVAQGQEPPAPAERTAQPAPRSSQPAPASKPVPTSGSADTAQATATPAETALAPATAATPPVSPQSSPSPVGQASVTPSAAHSAQESRPSQAPQAPAGSPQTAAARPQSQPKATAPTRPAAQTTEEPRASAATASQASESSASSQTDRSAEQGGAQAASGGETIADEAAYDRAVKERPTDFAVGLGDSPGTPVSFQQKNMAQARINKLPANKQRLLRIVASGQGASRRFHVVPTHAAYVSGEVKPARARQAQAAQPTKQVQPATPSKEQGGAQATPGSETPVELTKDTAHWERVISGLTEPNAHQRKLIEAARDVLADKSLYRGGTLYNDVFDREMRKRVTFSEAAKAEKMNVERGATGYEMYLARKAVEGEQERTANAEASKGFTVGAKVGTFRTVANGKMRTFTGGVVEKVTANTVTLTATMRGARKGSHTVTMSAAGLRNVLDQHATEQEAKKPAKQAQPAPSKEQGSKEFTQADFDRIRAKPASERTQAEVDAANAFTRARDAKARAAESEAAAAKQAERDDTDGFADGMTPMQRQKVINALNVTVRRNGKVQTRKQAVRDAVTAGATVGEQEGERALIAPSGAYTLEKDLSKTAIDYAQHLIAQKNSSQPTAGTEAAAEIPAWHTPLPTEGLPITAAQTKRGGYEGVPHAVAEDAYNAITQQQRVNGEGLYAYFMPAADGRNGIARLVPDDQKPGAPWKLLNGQIVRFGMMTKEQVVARLTEWLRSAPIIGEASQSTPAPQAAAQTSGKPDPGRYVQPKGNGSREQQMELANRGSTIASLKMLNARVAKINPDAAYSDHEIENAANLDALRNYLSEQQNPAAAEKAAGQPTKEKGKAETALESTEPVATLSGNEVAQTLTAENAVQAARAYFRQHMQGKPIHRDGFGDVRVTGKSLDELRRGMKMNPDKVRLLPAIRPVIESGAYEGRQALTKSRKDNIVAFHRFSAPVSIAGETKTVRVLVGEDRHGNLLYDVFAGNQEPPALSPERAGGAEGSSVGVAPTDQKVARESVEGNDEGVNVEELSGLDLTPEERASFQRQQDHVEGNQALRDLAAQQSREEGEADAEKYGLRKAVTKLLGPTGLRVQFLRDHNGLPEDMRADLENRDKSGRAVRNVALYSPATKEVFIFTSRVKDPIRAAWHAAHELAGHDGLRKLLGHRLDAVLRLAATNPTVKKLAAAIYAERDYAGRVARGEKTAEGAELESIEEALAELAAAVRTGDYGQIESRYGVEVPKGIREKVVEAIKDFLRRLKNLLNRQIGREAFTDQDVRSLLEHAWQAAQEESPESARLVGLQLPVSGTPTQGSEGTVAPSRESVNADQTQTPAFRKWFADSKVVDAEGMPLVVYHGTDTEFDEFDTVGVEGGAFFTVDPVVAGEFAVSASEMNGGEPQTVSVYLSIQNPAILDASDVMDSVRVGQGEALSHSFERMAAAIKTARRVGHDGMLIRNVPDGVAIADQWVAFHPEQIKSATANNGNFDASKPSILESTEPLTRRASETPADVLADVEAVMTAGQDKTLLQQAKDKLASLVPSKVKNETRHLWLAGLSTDMLAELGSDYNANTQHYAHFLKAMNADRNELQQQGDALAEDVRQWGSKHTQEAKDLFKLMHQATIDGVDPAKEYQPLQFRYSGKLVEVNAKNIKEALAAIRQQMRERSGDSKQDMLNEAKKLRAMKNAEPRRKAQYPTLKAKWDALTPEAQQFYVQMRKMYEDRSKMVEDGLVERLNDTDANAKAKRDLIDKIRQQFETQRLQGVYFPLQRFGQYFVAAEKGDSSTFLMFESQGKLEAGVKMLKDKGFTITAQGLKSQGKAADAPSGTFVAEVIDMLKKAHVSEKTQDDIYQAYLQALPELSMRKHAIHRKAVPGFDPDAVRGFAFNMLHGAHQIARLRYAHKLANTITLLRQQQDAARRDPEADTKKIVAFDGILNELDKRHQWIMNPTDSKATGLVSSFGFIYYLGLTPAAAMVNLTQTALLTFPYLAARHGPVRAMNHLLTGMRDTARTFGHIQKVLTDPDELAMHAELIRRGLLDKTQAFNLAGIAEGGLAGHNPQWAKAMSIIGMPFHKAEVFNREASAIAAYRLARQDGATHDAAVDAAARAVNDTHFDYTNQNRARVFQSGTAKTLLMFRQYSLNMTWHLGRMVWQATKNESPEVRKLARRNLAGVLGMSAIFSGTLGLPLMSVTFGVLNAIAASFGNPDEPWDAETEFRQFLDDMFGKGVGEVLANGPVNSLTGADIASRVSLSQLWFRDADRELDGQGAYYNLLEQAAGPMGGVLKNALVGKQLIDEGHTQRGIETMLPKAMKDALRAQRYATEGVNNLRGDPLVPDVSLRQTLLQLAGFTPDQVAQQYDVNRDLKNYEQAILDRRASLIDAFAMALRTEDDEARQEVLARIQHFNQTNPEIAITTKGLRQSIGRRARYSQDAENGIVLNRRLAAKIHAAVGE